MGLFSGVFKGVKKGFKRITKGIKTVFKGAFKAIKKFAGSKLGKLVIVAAAIYFGGVAAGAWGGAPAAGSAAAGVTAPTGVGMGGAGSAMFGGVAPTVNAAGVVSTGGTVASANMAGGVGGAIAKGGAQLGAGEVVNQAVAPPITAPPPVDPYAGQGWTHFSKEGVASPIASNTSAQSSVQQALEAPPITSSARRVIEAGGDQGGGFAGGAFKWMGKNPIPTIMAGQILSSVTRETPDPAAADKYRRRHSNIGGVGPSGQGSAIDPGTINTRGGLIRANLHNNLKQSTRG